MTPFLNITGMSRFFQYLIAFVGAFFAALWLSVIFWTYRDVRARNEDRVVHILAALLTTLLGPPGLIIYLILRPRQTIDEMYQSTLEEEALLSEVEGRSACPGCGGHTHPDWQVCANCHTRLRKPCAFCKRLMDLGWQVCPYCGTPAPGTRAEVREPATPIESQFQVDQE